MEETQVPDLDKMQNRLMVEGNSEEIGVDIKKDKPKQYTRKTNSKRFFYPREWLDFINSIQDGKHRFWFELLLHTGTRINEARGILIKDINFEREYIFLRKTKGGGKKQRTIQISSYLKKRIEAHISKNKLNKNDNLMFNAKTGKTPSTQYMDKVIKKYCKKAGIEDYREFSCHNIRKTLENWLVAININVLSIQAHMGHTIKIAAEFYVGTNLLNEEDRILIKTILGNLLQK